MILEHIEITGFRGISHLSLPLTSTNLLIGENAWGKSSLLDALTLLLSPQSAPYQFTAHDFHFPPGELEAQMRRLRIVFCFRAGPDDHETALASFWQQAEEGGRLLYYSVQGRRRDEGVFTSRRFLDARGDVLPEAGTAPAIAQLIRRSPVLRLRDARFSRRSRASEVALQPEVNSLATEAEALMRELMTRPQHLTDDMLRQGLQTLQQLLEHYFLVQPADASAPVARVAPQRRKGEAGWRSLDQLNQLISETDSRSHQLILLRMFSLLLQARGSDALAPGSQPLLLIEDPETRLHPIMLSVTWNLLEMLPLQKIATTNSSELLSQVPVEHVCRLVREAERVTTWRIGPEGLSAEESRRIGFHIRVNRPSALFARCWLLVEGETEVWIINELARQCGYHFAAEGVKVIEFAQSGLRPLLKFARRMGIAWHVLTDGDDAGKKYAASARGQLQHGEAEDDHLTQLPALDMENFLYRQGFSEVYREVAHLPLNVPMNARRIITKAIHHASKPELAIAVAMSAAERGPSAIPPLLNTLFARVMWLARGKAD